MSYQVLSLKWRPQVFQDVVGQEHVSQTLINAFKKDRVAQAYLFTGPRGIGKTTTARILAKALNCLESPGDPCNTCTNCKEISGTRNMDVLEIDGASNRGIEEIRNLRELIKYSPINSRYKIFIIDEVHMLTTQAFNALLRTLEEPPSHGKFILATTDIHKVPATIISRCQRFDFNRISIKTISDRVQYIMEQEKIDIDEESIQALARKADGSMRDALSILDQIIAYCGEKVTYDDVVKVLGMIPYDLYFRLTDALSEKDTATLFQFIEEIQFTGLPVGELVLGLNEHMRNLMFATVTNGIKVLEINQDLKERYIQKAKNWNIRDLLRITRILTELESQVKWASHPYILFEMTMLKLIEMDSSVSIEEILQLLSNSNQMTIPASPAEKAALETGKSKKPSAKTKKVDVELSVFDNQESSEKPDKTDTEKRVIKEPAGAEKSEQEIYTLIVTNWEKITEDISGRRPSLGSILEHCKVNKISGNQMDVVMFDQPQFNLKALEKNHTIIEDLIGKYSGKQFRINFSIENDVEGKKAKKSPSQLKNDGTKKTDDDSTVTRIIELFDGEIIR